MIYGLRKKEEYLKTIRRPYSPFWISFFASGWSRREYYGDLFGNPLEISSFALVDSYCFYLKKELDEIGQRTFSCWSNPDELKKIKEVLRKKEKSLIGVTSGSLKEFETPFESYVVSIIAVWPIEKLIEKELRKALGEKIGESEAEKYLDKLNIPFEDNFYKKEEYDLVNTEDISAHVKEYEWIKSRYGKIDPYTEKEAKEKLKNINKKEFLLEWEESKKELQKTIKEVKDALGSEQSHIVDLMQFIIFYRTQRTDIVNKAIYLFAPTLKKMAKKLDLTYDQIIYCAKDELLYNNIPSLEIIQERKKGFSVILDGGIVKCYSGKNNKEIVDFFKEGIEDISEFRGSLACKGSVTGRAKIILNTADFEKFQEGDVLVTSMTTPNFVPIMKEASAFVTDEGGITCHAAIISREMKKPCIIGTKIATQVLKDGDLVEVDANEGIVKILKRSDNNKR